MKDKHDFNRAYKDFEDWLMDCEFNQFAGEAYSERIKAIQTALRLADRLQSGDVSEGMFNQAFKLRNAENGFDPDYSKVFKSMAQQMIKECDDEKTNH